MPDFNLQFYKDEAEYYKSKLDYHNRYFAPVPAKGIKGKIKEFVKSYRAKKRRKQQERNELKRKKEYSVPVDGLNHEKREIPVIVSLTSFPARMGEVPAAIGSMLRQTMKPDRIILHLTKSQFEGKELPEQIKALMDKSGVEVVFCEENLKPHTKYLYAMLANPDAIIVTVDDDIIYRPTLIEELYASYLRHPDCVSCVRAHKIRFTKEGKLMPYNDWIMESHYGIDVPSHQLLATGVGGVLYPPRCLPEEAFDKKAIEATCLNADDLWLKVMEIRKGTKVVLCADSQLPQEILQGAQTVSLLSGNVAGGKNDEQMQKILDYFSMDLADYIIED